MENFTATSLISPNKHHQRHKKFCWRQWRDACWWKKNDWQKNLYVMIKIIIFIEKHCVTKKKQAHKNHPLRYDDAIWWRREKEREEEEKGRVMYFILNKNLPRFCLIKYWRYEIDGEYYHNFSTLFFSSLKMLMI